MPVATLVALRDVYMALDPLSLLHGIRSAQGALAALTVSGDTPQDPSKEEDLAGFLAQLPTLWKGGEVRATHRKPVKERHWCSREDPFASVWEEVKSWLEAEPDATAKALFFRDGCSVTQGVSVLLNVDGDRCETDWNSEGGSPRIRGVPYRLHPASRQHPHIGFAHMGKNSVLAATIRDRRSLNPMLALTPVEGEKDRRFSHRPCRVPWTTIRICCSR